MPAATKWPGSAKVVVSRPWSSPGFGVVLTPGAGAVARRFMTGHGGGHAGRPVQSVSAGCPRTAHAAHKEPNRTGSWPASSSRWIVWTPRKSPARPARLPASRNSTTRHARITSSDSGSAVLTGLTRFEQAKGQVVDAKPPWHLTQIRRLAGPVQVPPIAASKNTANARRSRPKRHHAATRQQAGRGPQFGVDALADRAGRTR